MTSPHDELVFDYCRAIVLHGIIGADDAAPSAAEGSPYPAKADHPKTGSPLRGGLPYYP